MMGQMEYKLYRPYGIRTWQHEFRVRVRDGLIIREEPDPDTRRPEGQIIESHPVVDFPEGMIFGIDRADELSEESIPIVATGTLDLSPVIPTTVHYRYALDLDASTNEALVYRKDF